MIDTSGDVRSALRARRTRDRVLSGRRQRGFLIDPYRGSSSAVGKLDAYQTNIWAEYSCLYLLKGTYSGSPLIKVRNGTTNVETDIGHDGAGFISTAALTAAAGGASLFVKTLYDQTGNGRHFTQGTSGAQPRIVNAGTFDKSMIFDHVDDFMVGATMTGIAKELTLLLTYDFAASPTSTDTWMFLEPSPNYTSNSCVWVYGGDVGGTGSGINGFRWLTGDGTNRADVIFVPGSIHAMAAIFDRSQSVNTNQIKVVASSGQLTLGAGPNVTSPVPSNNFGTGAFNLGARAGTSNFAPLKFQNLAIYLAAKSVADMTAATALLPLYT